MTTEPYTDTAAVITRLVELMAPRPPAEIDVRSRLVGDLGFNSLSLVEMSFALEDLFEFDELPAEEAASIQRVEDIVELVVRELGDGTGKLPEAGQLDDLAKRYGTTWVPTT